jgi:hypothetical protein
MFFGKKGSPAGIVLHHPGGDGKMRLNAVFFSGSASKPLTHLVG